MTAATPAALTGRLAELKAEAVFATLEHGAGRAGPRLRLDARAGRAAYGKPSSAAEATERWRGMRGRTGVLHTGHQVILGRAWATVRRRAAVASTTVHFADLSDAEIEAYVGTGEPLQVAGAFTVDGLGGPFVTRIEGDYHNVVGLSLPLLRTMLIELGIDWPTLWSAAGR